MTRTEQMPKIAWWSAFLYSKYNWKFLPIDQMFISRISELGLCFTRVSSGHVFSSISFLFMTLFRTRSFLSWNGSTQKWAPLPFARVWETKRHASSVGHWVAYLLGRDRRKSIFVSHWHSSVREVREQARGGESFLERRSLLKDKFRYTAIVSKLRFLFWKEVIGVHIPHFSVKTSKKNQENIDCYVNKNSVSLRTYKKEFF